MFETPKEQTATYGYTTEQLEEMTVPEKGHRIYLDDDYHWIIKKVDMPTYKMIKRLSRAGEDSKAALHALKTLCVAGTQDPKNIDDPDVVMGIEDGIFQIFNPMTAQVKKN